MKLKDRTEFLEAYANACVEDMDIKTLCVFAQETIEGSFDDLTDEDLIREISDDGNGPYEWILTEHVIND